LDTPREEELATSIRDCLHKLCKHDPMVHPDYVADSIESKESFLQLHDGGFSILTPHPDRLHIWVACAWNGHGDMSISITDIINVAKLLKLPQITFATTRKGWQKVAPKLGFHFDGEFYVRETDVQAR